MTLSDIERIQPNIYLAILTVFLENCASLRLDKNYRVPDFLFDDIQDANECLDGMEEEEIEEVAKNSEKIEILLKGRRDADKVKFVLGWFLDNLTEYGELNEKKNNDKQKQAYS